MFFVIAWFCLVMLVLHSYLMYYLPDGDMSTTSAAPRTGYSMLAVSSTCSSDVIGLDVSSKVAITSPWDDKVEFELKE